MNKGTHFIGQPMYGQLLNLLDKSKILRFSREMGGERYVKHFDAWQHLVIMLYAVIKRFDSLREITDSMFPGGQEAVAPWYQPDAPPLNPVGCQCPPQGVSSRPYTGICMPPTRTNFPRTAGASRFRHGSNGCKSSTPRPSRCSPTSFSRAWDDIRRRERKKEESRSMPTSMPTRASLRTSASPRLPPMYNTLPLSISTTMVFTHGLS